ncbi:MAG TPA: hypothetical protein G4N98_10350 [Thermoflexia bacterium]|nr:hypothetical protein [Thermoflexia bacterium]
MTLAEKTLPADFVVDENLAQAIRARMREEKLPCAVAFAIAAQQEVSPRRVGQTADVLQIHLSHCQLGLFGYPAGRKGWELAPSTPLALSDEIQAALHAAVTESGTLACAQLWELAAQFRVPKLRIGQLCDELGIKITPCQLGAF